MPRVSILALAIAGSLVLTLVVSRNVTRDKARGEQTPEGAVSAPAQQHAAETSTPTPHPVSLQALMTKTFEGRDLAVGPVLENTADYMKYAVTYKSGALTISGVLLIPKSGEDPFPVIVTNHGYIDPSVYTTGRGLRREQASLARHGYAVLHPDYRNHAESDDDPERDVRFRLGYAEDAINAVKAVQSSSLPYLDTERIGMLGHSMGGGVTLNILVAQPSLIRAAVLYAPVSGDARDNFQRWLTRRPAIAQRILETYGSPEDQPAFWDNVSARTFFDRVIVPVQIHHGTSDASVPYEWSLRLEEALRNAKKDVTLHTYDAEAHEFGPRWGTFMERTVAFFDSHVKQAQKN